VRLGLTYDLRAEYLAAGYGHEETAELDREDTIAALEEALRALGHAPERIGNLFQLARRLVEGARWDLVFNIAEGLHGIGREAQVPALLDAWRIPYTFSDPLVMSLTLHKGMTKRVVRDAGLATPPFVVVDRPGEEPTPPFGPPYFVKPAAEGTGKGITPRSLVPDRQALPEACARLLEVYRQPVLVEAYLPGREFTTGIAGSGPRARVLGTIEVLLGEGAEAGMYSFANKENYEKVVSYRLLRPEEDRAVAEAEALALAAWRVLGCRDGGRIDLRCDAAGRPQFLEVNPLAGLHPVHSDLPIICRHLGMPYRDLIGAIVDSAAERLTSAPAPCV
jgi:D-alanine-D-alanine ligase